MLGDVGLGEVAVLVVLALFIFGPDRLPKMAAELGRGLRQLRRMAKSARRDLQDGLGPEMRDFDITDLHPRTFVRKNLLEGFDDDDEEWDQPKRNGHRLDYGERPPYDADAT